MEPCRGSWSNAAKAQIPFPLFYIDYSVALSLVSVILMISMGRARFFHDPSGCDAGATECVLRPVLVLPPFPPLGQRLVPCGAAFAIRREQFSRCHCVKLQQSFQRVVQVVPLSTVANVHPTMDGEPCHRSPPRCGAARRPLNIANVPTMTTTK